MHHLNSKSILLIILFIFCATAGYPQQQQKLPRGAQYFLGTGDELLIRVNIWGFVNKPGQYMVPTDTDLISLISYAGGPGKGAKLTKIKIVHLSENGKGENIIREVNIKDYLEKGNKAENPHLLPGDTIIVSGSKWYHVNSFVEFVTKIAVIAQIYSWIMYYSNR